MSEETLKLPALLGDYPNTSAVRKGQLRSPRVELKFADVKEPSHAFKRVVRDLEFDVAELAVVTYLTAKAHSKPLVLLPVVVQGKFQHESIVCSAERPLGPADLVGRRVGIRSHSVTTVAWVRGILQNDYGIDLNGIKWITFEDAHVAEIRDPAGYERAPAGKNAMDMLVNGELDAAVMTGASLMDPRVHPVIADPAAAAKRWYEKHGLVPINHMVTVKQSTLKANPWVAQEVFGMLAEAKRAAGLPAAGVPDRFPLGVEPNRKSLEMIIGYAAQQGLIPRRFSVDELFDDATCALGK